MLNIKCPFCGPRLESEFAYGGPVVAKRPEAPQDLSDAEWVEFLTHVPNPVGPVQEKWWHARGCGGWLTLWRDTVTHEIIADPKAAR